MKTLYIIPARGGSKGIPGKNIKPLAGKPLIYYSIDVARELTSDENICVSTDDDKIIDVVQSYGLSVPFKRPDELATDTSGSYEVILNVLNYYENKGINYDNIVLLQPTSPFRTSRHVNDALNLFNFNLDMVVSVKETKSNPYYLLFEENTSGYLVQSKSGNFTRRQDVPKVWEYNGAIYVMNVDSLKACNISSFKKVKKFVMNEIDSIDLDTLLDWEFAEFLIVKP